MPPDDYWPKIADVCRRHGVLLIADEVMTGFGRTGRWFGLDHWAVRPDLLVAAKGATSGYWPFGFVAASGAVHDAVDGRARLHPRVHVLARTGGRAAVAREVLRILEDEDLVAASRARATGSVGARAASIHVEAVGDIRGRGLLVGIELVADRETRGRPARAA